MSFLTSIAIIILSSLLLGELFEKIRLPRLVGMLLVGVLLGPHVFNLISPDVLNVSSDLRQFALIIILTRAGMSLKTADLKKVGRPAILLSFLPATFEIIGYVILTPLLLNLSIKESLLLGTVMAAVSPAVVVPRMLKLLRQGYGTNKNIPQMITAGASCDDVWAIVLFSALLTTAQTNDFDFNAIWKIPVSIVFGVTVGVSVGLVFALFLKRFHIRDTIKILLFLSFSFLFVALENFIKSYVPFSGLLAIISLGITFNLKSEKQSKNLSVRYEKLWVFTEIILFVLVGAEIDIKYAVSAGMPIFSLLLCTLVFRVFGVFLSLIKTPLNFRERLFCAFAYLPKATVQATIGTIPLSLSLPCGKIILTCSILAILITAPIGALATDLSYKKLLFHDPSTISLP